MAVAKEQDVAEMFARCENLITRSHELGIEHKAVMDELEGLITAIDAALDRASNVE